MFASAEQPTQQLTGEAEPSQTPADQKGIGKQKVAPSAEFSDVFPFLLSSLCDFGE